MNNFFERLGVGLLIIQAPMAGVQGIALAAAVSNAGNRLTKEIGPDQHRRSGFSLGRLRPSAATQKQRA